MIFSAALSSPRHKGREAVYVDGVKQNWSGVERMLATVGRKRVEGHMARALGSESSSEGPHPSLFVACLEQTLK